jgi:chemotaxis protein CheD
MFSFTGGSSELDIGGRNREGVLEGLGRSRVRVAAEATGGNKGRTVRVFPEGGVVVVKEAGGTEFELGGEQLRRAA